MLWHAHSRPISRSWLGDDPFRGGWLPAAGSGNGLSAGSAMRVSSLGAPCAVRRPRYLQQVFGEDLIAALVTVAVGASVEAVHRTMHLREDPFDAVSVCRGHHVVVRQRKVGELLVPFVCCLEEGRTYSCGKGAPSAQSVGRHAVSFEW